MTPQTRTLIPEPPAPQTRTLEPAQPEQPSALERIAAPTLGIPKGIAHLIQAGLSTEKGTELVMGMLNNLSAHLKQGAETIAHPEVPSERLSTGLSQMAGGLPIVGPFFDAVAKNDVPSMIGEALPFALPEAAVRGVSKVAKVAAPSMVDAALGETATMRGKFPNSATRAVTDRVVLKPDVSAKAKATEATLTRIIAQADARRPSVAGYLGPATTETTSLPTGPAPTGEAIRVTASDAVKNIPKTGLVRGAKGRFTKVQTTTGLYRGDGGRITSVPNQYLGTSSDSLLGGFGGPGVIQQQTPIQTASAPRGTAPPTMVAPMDLAEQAKQWVLDRARLKGQGGRGFRAEAQAELDGLVDRYLTENSKPMTLSETLGQKRAEQEIASPSYTKRAAGSPMTNIEALWHEGLAAAARRELIRHVPDAADLLRAEQELIGLEKATKRADQPIGATVKNAHGFKGIATGIAMSPRILGRAGLASADLSQLLDQIAPWANRLGPAAAVGRKD